MATREPIDRALLGRFADIVGAAHALTGEEATAPFVKERRGLFPGRAAIVLLPASTAEVARIMALASETRTPVVPQGGNTGLVGGQVPDASGSQVVLAMKRMNRIREIDLSSATITAEAGVILQDLQKAADEAGRLFPLSLGSQGSCQIGGNLSSNAGGTGVLAYGNARELCLGVEVVLPTGEILDDLRKLKKDNTGYDLKNLFIGAEGTLGVITAAVMKLFPKPEGREIAWIGLSSPDDALRLFEQVSARAGGGLTAFELIGELIIDFTVRHVPDTRAPLAGRHPWQVMMEYSSSLSSEHARAELESLLAPALEEGIVGDAIVTGSLSQVGALWRLRESMSDAQGSEGFSIKHDISVPVAMIPEFIRRAGKAVLAVAPGARIVCFGHMGDGNLHYNISEPAGGDTAAFRARFRDVNRAVHDVVRALDGSISAEHGIGQLKRDELAETAPRTAIDLMRRIRGVLDPAGIMNPGKLL
jgi:FAD/FMN-containing dehydrogenase